MCPTPLLKSSGYVIMLIRCLIRFSCGTSGMSGKIASKWIVWHHTEPITPKGKRMGIIRMFQQKWFILFGAISFILSQLDESSNIVILKTLCHRKRWPRSSFLSQERPWPLTFRKISSILAKILYFSTFFDLFFSFREEESLPIAFIFTLFSGTNEGKKKGLDEKIPCQKWRCLH